MSKSTLYLLFKILNSYFGLPSSPSVRPKALCLHCSMPQCFLFSFLPSQSFPSAFLVCSRVIYFPLWPSSPLLPLPLPFLCPQSPMFPLSPANVFLFFFLFPVIAPQTSPFVLLFPFCAAQNPLAFGKLLSAAGAHLCCPSSHSCPR